MVASSRPNLHHTFATWGAILTVATAVTGVAFTAGDAKQTLTGQGGTLIEHGQRLTVLERDVSDMKATLARIDQASSDTRDTVHRLERAHVHNRADD